MYLFFEALTLKDASPAFVSKIGIVITDNDDLSWVQICHRMKNLFYKKHEEFFTLLDLKPQVHIDECLKEFLVPYIEKLMTFPKIQQWRFFNPKSSILTLFNILNAIFYRIKEIYDEKKKDDEHDSYMLKECERDVFWSSMMLATVWSFGAPLNRELRKIFEEQFFTFRRKFNINIGGPGRARFTLFDIFFDPESLQWDLLQEKLEYKLKLHYDSLTNALYIPCVEVS